MNNDLEWIDHGDGYLYYAMCFEDNKVGEATHTLVAVLEDLGVLGWVIGTDGEVYIKVPK